MLNMFMFPVHLGQFRRRRPISEKAKIQAIRPCQIPFCDVCAGKRESYMQHPEKRFTPETLRLKGLLQIVYQLADAAANERQLAENAEKIGLPTVVIASVVRITKDMLEWVEQMWSIVAFTDLFRCYVRDLHWTKDGRIDSKASNELISLNQRLDVRYKIFLAAANCEESSVRNAWALLAAAQMPTPLVMRAANPSVVYWERVVHGRVPSWPQVHSAFFWAAFKNVAPAYIYFHEILIRRAPDEKTLTEAISHAFHGALKKEKLDVVGFIWSKLVRAQRATVISSSGCCGEFGSFEACRIAIATQSVGVVKFLVSLLAPDELNQMLLAYRCRVVKEAVQLKSDDIFHTLWNEATPTQRFIIAFEQDGRVFQEALKRPDAGAMETILGALSADDVISLLSVQGECPIYTLIGSSPWTTVSRLVELLDRSKLDKFYTDLLPKWLESSVAAGNCDVVRGLLDIQVLNAKTWGCDWEGTTRLENGDDHSPDPKMKVNATGN